jgi:adenine specific DNA methylase Mod
VKELVERIQLVEAEELAIVRGERDNWLVEGENLLVLEYLLGSHRGKIDVICIDPPYNTGMQSLGYDDSRPDTGDGPAARHGRWLSRIHRRLRLALELLSPRGVVFIHVDQHEMARLCLACERLFGEANVEVAIWPKTDPRFDQNRVERPFRNMRMTHEYVLVCYRNREGTTFNKFMRPTCVGGVWTDVPGDLDSILSGLGTTSSAKDELAELLGSRDVFQTPKPRRLIKELVRSASTPDSYILDFYAGSGTTGHAVMDLNAEDGGSRKFILATNNEGNICRNVTYPRLRRAIERHGYPETVRYFVVGVRDDPSAP